MLELWNKFKHSPNELVDVVSTALKKKLLLHCQDFIDVDRPDVEDYWKADNPYEARYNKKWPDKIKKTTFSSPYICITDLVEHMVKESEKVFQNTRYENNWYFYHNALTLMTLKECRNWMEKRNCEKHWLLSE